MEIYDFITIFSIDAAKAAQTRLVATAHLTTCDSTQEFRFVSFTLFGISFKKEESPHIEPRSLSSLHLWPHRIEESKHLRDTCNLAGFCYGDTCGGHLMLPDRELRRVLRRRHMCYSR